MSENMFGMTDTQGLLNSLHKIPIWENAPPISQTIPPAFIKGIVHPGNELYTTRISLGSTFSKSLSLVMTLAFDLQIPGYTEIPLNCCI